LEDPEIAKSADFYEQRYIFNFFPELVDYDTGRVLVEYDEVATFLQSFLAFKQAKGFGFASDRRSTDFAVASKFMYKSSNWILEERAMRAGWSLGDVIAETAMAKWANIDLQIYPLTSPNGEIVAEIRQFGAINYGCENVPLAYEFLRELLTEASQWGQNEIIYSCNWSGSLARDSYELQGYPVRTKKSVEPLYYDALMTAAEYRDFGFNSDQTRVQLREIPMSNKDIPILNEDIAVFRYPTAGIEWQFAMDIVQEFEQNGWDPEAVDIETAVDTLISELEVYMWTE